jgi:hypothetical protein
MIAVNESKSDCTVRMLSSLDRQASARQRVESSRGVSSSLQLTDTNRRRCVSMIQRRSAAESPFVSSISATVLGAGRV